MGKALTIVAARRLTANPAACRAIRLAAGLTLAELASLMDPPAALSAISRWERGLRRPRTDEALRYAAVLEDLRRG